MPFRVATVGQLLIPPAGPSGLLTGENADPSVYANPVIADFLPVATIGQLVAPHTPVVPGRRPFSAMCLSPLNIVVTGIPTILVNNHPVAVATSQCLCPHTVGPVNVVDALGTVFAGGTLGGVG